MKLISCTGCGVVLDQDKLIFPDIFDEDYNRIEGNSEWDGNDFIPIIQCPTCKHNIKEEE